VIVPHFSAGSDPDDGEDEDGDEGGDSDEEREDADEDDANVSLLVSSGAGISREQAKQALQASDGCLEQAQMWLMTNVVYRGMHAHAGGRGGGRASGGGRGGGGVGPGAGRGSSKLPAGVKAPGPGGRPLTKEELEEQRFLEEQEAQNARDLEQAQLLSEKAAEEDNRRREAQRRADAREDPVGMFEEKSVFLRETMQNSDGAPGAALSRAQLDAHKEPLSELLLMEFHSQKHWGKHADAYFVEKGRELRLAPDAESRGTLLRRWVKDIGDSSKPGTIYGMAVPGQGSGLPPCLRVGAIVVDEVILVE
jgi:hypothetical protein